MRAPFPRDRSVTVGFLIATLVFWAAVTEAQNAAAPTRAEVEAAARRAVTYACDELSEQGGYLWWYAIDGSTQAGENVVPRTTVWVQPPGTPAVGLAYLNVYDATGDPFYLVAASNVGHALVFGQMDAGGWAARIDFGPVPEGMRPLDYLHQDNPPRSAFTYSTLDDDITQSALRFLLRLDDALGGRDAQIHDTLERGLAGLLQAQYADGSFPQVYPAPDRPATPRPDLTDWDWRDAERQLEYWFHATLNDHVMATCIDTLLLAWDLRQDERYLQAAIGAGQFLINARLSESQPVWAQQYDADGYPAWARRFEPPAACTAETWRVLIALEQLAQATGDDRFREPIAPARRWLESVRLPDGRWARYYEVNTNRPLYMNTSYEVTYQDRDLPTHYAFKVTLELTETGPPTPDEIADILASQDASGRWLTPRTDRHGTSMPAAPAIIDMGRMNHNLNRLALYLQGSDADVPDAP